MKRVVIGLCCVLFALAPCAADAEPVTEVDSYIDPAFDFSSITSICPLPVSIDEMPDIVSLSLPMQADHWIEETLTANNGSRRYTVDPAAAAVLKISAAVRAERKWQEPRTEYYWTTMSVPAARPRRRRGGRVVWDDIEIPVRRQRTIPGYWYTAASVQCSAELYDTDNPDKPVASARASGEDSGRGSEKQIIRVTVRKTLEDMIGTMLK